MLRLSPVIISVIALALSGLTAWLTLLRRGQISMTRPSMIYLGPDGGRTDSPKVYLRTLLFCTAKRGRILESLYVSVQRGETLQNFSLWVLGDKDLNGGSGLFVGEEGVVANHHFLPPIDENDFKFLQGSYRLKVHAIPLGSKKSSVLFAQDLILDTAIAEAIRSGVRGVNFEWRPDSGSYTARISDRPEKARHDAILASLRAEAESGGIR